VTTPQTLLIILVVAALTFLTRVLPFLLFRNLDRPAAWLVDLGRLLPPAVIAILIVYCLRSIEVTQAGSWLTQLLSVAVVIGLHLWKRNNLISIGGGTCCYMILIRLLPVT
jgi:branched-subunit amino acid transport protein AzlD